MLKICINIRVFLVHVFKLVISSVASLKLLGAFTKKSLDLVCFLEKKYLGGFLVKILGGGLGSTKTPGRYATVSNYHMCVFIITTGSC
jgi:hypothetical protein